MVLDDETGGSPLDPDVAKHVDECIDEVIMRSRESDQIQSRDGTKWLMNPLSERRPTSSGEYNKSWWWIECFWASQLLGNSTVELEYFFQ